MKKIKTLAVRVGNTILEWWFENHSYTLLLTSIVAFLAGSGMLGFSMKYLETDSVSILLGILLSIPMLLGVLLSFCALVLFVIWMLLLGD